jgi:PTS system cellobiose-specific IIA component
MEALYLAKKGKFEEAKVKMAESHKAIAIASHAHFEVIQKEAQGTQLEFKILFMHSEDQLLTTQTLMLLVEELIYIHKVIKK